MALGRANKRTRDELTWDNCFDPNLAIKPKAEDIREIITENPDIVKPIIDDAVTSICIRKTITIDEVSKLYTVYFDQLYDKQVMAMYFGGKAYNPSNMNPTGNFAQVITSSTGNTGSIGSGVTYSAYLYQTSSGAYTEENKIHPRIEVKATSNGRVGDVVEVYALFLIPKI